MSGPKHTPGPWRITNYGGVFWIHTGDDVDNPLGLLGKAAKEADAKLIVAAPHLVEAATALMAAIDTMPVAYTSGHRNAERFQYETWPKAVRGLRAALREAGVIDDA